MRNAVILGCVTALVAVGCGNDEGSGDGADSDQRSILDQKQAGQRSAQECFKVLMRESNRSTAGFRECLQQNGVKETEVYGVARAVFADKLPPESPDRVVVECHNEAFAAGQDLALSEARTHAQLEAARDSVESALKGEAACLKRAGLPVRSDFGAQVQSVGLPALKDQWVCSGTEERTRCVKVGAEEK